MEYEYAAEAGLPVLAFLHKDPGVIATNKTESTDEGKAALKAFREKIEAARHAKFWVSPKDLALAVFQSMSSLMRTKPRIGWVRSDQARDEGAAQKILGLLKKIDELNAHLAETEQTAPPGAEEFARGEETISLNFRYKLDGRYDDSPAESFSWNSILSTLGPILIVHASEHDLKKKLSEAFRNRFKDKFGTQIFDAYMRDEEFQKVKVQLRALGLIRELKDKSPGSGDAALWTLTPYGDHLMTQVAAIRSSAKA
jgi:hypothetical protein